MDTTRELHLTGATIRYRDSGGEGPVVLFLHGVLVDGRLWRKVVDALGPGVRCVVPDLPLGAHALPVPQADLSVPGVARMAAEIMERLDLRDVTVVGNDTGGAIAQVLAGQRPERMARLVLTPCDAFDNFPPAVFRPLFRVAKGQRVIQAVLAPLRVRALRRAPFAFGWLAKRPIPHDITDAWLRPPLTRREIREDAVRLLARVDPAITVAASEGLRAFDRPALIAWAAEDKLFPVDHAHRLAAILPDARVELIPDSYTFVAEDQPARLAELIGPFVREPAGARA